MTKEPQRNDPKYTQGYWVELDKARLAGGVSAETQGWEVGAGAVYKEDSFGLTGYLQYGIPFLQGRLQVDLMSDKQWQPHIALGVPLPLGTVKFESHILWALGKDSKPKLGLRVQYQF